ncbi:MAG: hypothetical protein JSV04_07255 [Candidatus Heimdallarchaeota archaeon]|nr:MAG: hypothetical protein JSV04_07255 [Candidatus Heimdallarchaeota archaeon]
MRKIVVKSSRVLLTLSGIGVLIIIIGLLYLLGVANWVDETTGIWNRFPFGFHYMDLIAYGVILLLIGFLPVFSVLDTRAKRTIKKTHVHLLFLTGIGILLIIYSALVSGEYTSTFDPEHSWFDYFILGTLLIIVGLIPFLFSVQNRERLWSFKFLYALFVLVGLLLLLVAFVVYGEMFEIPGFGWELILLMGTIVLFLGVVPLLMTAGQGFQEFLHRLRFILVLGVLIGIGLVLGSYLVYSEILPSSVVSDIEWLIFMASGSLLLILTVSMLASVEQHHGAIHKLRLIWFATLIIGVFCVIISFVLILNKTEFGEITGNLEELFEIRGDFFYFFGSVLSIFSLILICADLFFETQETGDAGELLESVEDLPGIETTSSEMVAYLEILNKSQKFMVNQFKEAVRDDKFRPRVFEALVNQYKDRSRAITSRLDGLRKKGAITGLEDVEDLFDAALEPVKAEPGVPPPTPTPEAAPPVPTSPPPVPPSPTAPPPPPGPTVPTTAPPPPSPITMPTAPTPTPPTDSPLDLIADARSTSIAELRGEMLKELRRLREIFKED